LTKNAVYVTAEKTTSMIALSISSLELRQLRRHLLNYNQCLIEIFQTLPRPCISDVNSVPMCADRLPLKPATAAYLNRAISALRELSRLHSALIQFPEFAPENTHVVALAHAIFCTLDDANSALALIERIS